MHSLRPILQKCISENQGASLPGKRATEHSYSQGSVPSYESKLLEKRRFASFSLIFGKPMTWYLGRSYPNVLKLWFHQGDVARIMHCATATTDRVCINGHPTDPIVAMRGLHQGDPISPYLFLICGEALARAFLRSSHTHNSIFPYLAPKGHYGSHGLAFSLGSKQPRGSDLRWKIPTFRLLNLIKLNQLICQYGNILYPLETHITKVAHESPGWLLSALEQRVGHVGPNKTSHARSLRWPEFWKLLKFHGLIPNQLMISFL